MEKLDPTNIKIIKHLRDGRKSLREIAESISITENTVRSRVNKMQSEDVLDIMGLVDPHRTEGFQIIFVGIKLVTMNLSKKAEEFSKLRGVVSASVVTGRYDVMLIVLLSDDFGLLEFFNDEVSIISEVLSAETFVVYQGYNMKVPFVL